MNEKLREAFIDAVHTLRREAEDSKYYADVTLKAQAEVIQLYDEAILLASRIIGDLLDALQEILDDSMAYYELLPNSHRMTAEEYYKEQIEALAPWEKVRCPECRGIPDELFCDQCGKETCEDRGPDGGCTDAECKNPNCKDGKVWRERD